MQNTITSSISVDAIVHALQCERAVCPCHKNGAGTHLLHCPAHDDEHPSLSVRQEEDKILVHCFAGCTNEAVVNALRARSLWNKPDQSVERVKPLHPAQGLTLEELANGKKLPLEFLRSLGLSDSRSSGINAVKIPYLDASGNIAAVRFRLGLDKTGVRFKWRRGDHPMLYGLDRREEIRKTGWVLVVEGESDCWTAWYYDLPALGMPGKTTWRAEWAEFLSGLDIYLWREPDASDLVDRLAKSCKHFRVIVPPDGVKDLSEAHLLGYNVPDLIAQLRANATPIEKILRDQSNERIAELKTLAAPILKADDPLVLVEDEIRRLGYGGDIKPALIVYLAATSRILTMRAGAMPVHLILISPPSGGKSWTINTVLRLLPDTARHNIDAGSPRALIYDNSDLRHKVIVFAEADSLPSGEDNPAASAVRNLLQDNRLHYGVVIRDPESGNFTVREVEKKGPTVLITTAVRSLGDQLMTRLFTLELADDPAQVRAALFTQADIEMSGAPEPNAALIGYQDYLQANAPWDIYVPFVRELADAIGHTAMASRILRDFARLTSLIKSVAVLRHQHRQRDAEGRIVAEIADYATVFDLVGEMYVDSVSGASKRSRELVETIERMHSDKSAGDASGPVSVTDVAQALGISKMAASRRVKYALKNGWLVNSEIRKGYPADLSLGEPMPRELGLPPPESLACNTLTPLTD